MVLYFPFYPQNDRIINKRHFKLSIKFCIGHYRSTYWANTNLEIITPFKDICVSIQTNEFDINVAFESNEPLDTDQLHVARQSKAVVNFYTWEVCSNK